MSTTTEQVEFAHPAWCSAGRYCDAPQAADDGTIEWAHGGVLAVVDGMDTTADVCVMRMDRVTSAGRHRMTRAIVLTAPCGSFDAEQAAELGQALLDASRLLAAGLPGTPGGAR